MAKESVHQFFLQAVARFRRPGLDHLVREVSKFAGRKWASFEFHRIAKRSGRSLDGFEGRRRVSGVERPAHGGASRAELFCESRNSDTPALHRVRQRPFNVEQVG